MSQIPPDDWINVETRAPKDGKVVCIRVVMEAICQHFHDCAGGPWVEIPEIPCNGKVTHWRELTPEEKENIKPILGSFDSESP